MPDPNAAESHGPRPSMGRIVFYTTSPEDPGLSWQEWPAIILAVTGEAVTLKVFIPSGDRIVGGVPFDARAADGPGRTWRWPPRV